MFSDGSAYASARRGPPEATIVLRRRAAEWRMALGGMFEFLESYFNGDIDLIGEHALRRLIDLGFRSRSVVSSTR